MNKKITSLILTGVLMAAPFAVLAQTQPADSCTMNTVIPGANCPGVGSVCAFDDTAYDCGLCCVLQSVYTVTNWIFFALVAVTALLVIWGGFTIATAGGDPGKVGTGRNFILFAMVGLAVALLSRAIPALTRSLLGL